MLPEALAGDDPAAVAKLMSNPALAEALKTLGADAPAVDAATAISTGPAVGESTFDDLKADLISLRSGADTDEASDSALSSLLVDRAWSEEVRVKREPVAA